MCPISPDCYNIIESNLRTKDRVQYGLSIFYTVCFSCIHIDVLGNYFHINNIQMKCYPKTVADYGSFSFYQIRMLRILPNWHDLSIEVLITSEGLGLNDILSLEYVPGLIPVCCL